MDPTFDPYHKWLAIPKEKQPPDHYQLLGIPLFEPDPDVICNAADQRMAHVRSFQTGEHQKLSQTILNEISAARICLLNPQKKADYDATLRERPAERSSVPPQLAVAAADASQHSMPQPDVPAGVDGSGFVAGMPLWLLMAMVGMGAGALCCWLLFPLIVGQRDRVAAGPTDQQAVRAKSEPTRQPDEHAELSQQDEPRETEPDNDRPDDEQPELGSREEPREMEEAGAQPDYEGPELTSREEPPQQGDQQPPPEPEENPPPLPEEPEVPEQPEEPPPPDAGPEAPGAAEPERPAPERRSEENLPQIRSILPDLYNLVYVVTQDVARADKLISDFDKGDPTVACLSYDNVTVYSRFDRYRRPDGLTVAFYNTDAPMNYLVYERGDRQGTVRTWDPEGNLKYCGQYHKGDRQGFCCLFEEGELKLAVNYGPNTVEAVHLVSNDRLLKSFDDENKAREDATAAAALEELNKLEDALKSNEIEFKDDLSETIKNLRRNRAGVRNIRNRQAIQQRMNQRSLMTKALTEGVRRQSFSSSGPRVIPH